VLDVSSCQADGRGETRFVSGGNRSARWMATVRQQPPLLGQSDSGQIEAVSQVADDGDRRREPVTNICRGAGSEGLQGSHQQTLTCFTGNESE
jgi:hypothetical protein